jgi:hypothetical protein
MYSTSLCSKHKTLVSRTIILKYEREENTVELNNKIDMWKTDLHINTWIPVGTALFCINQEITLWVQEERCGQVTWLHLPTRAKLPSPHMTLLSFICIVSVFRTTGRPLNKLRTTIFLKASAALTVHIQLDTSHPVGAVWMNDRPVADTTIWQHTTLTRKTGFHAPGEIRTHNPSKRSTADPRLRPRGYLNRLNLSSGLSNKMKTLRNT